MFMSPLKKVGTFLQPPFRSSLCSVWLKLIPSLIVGLKILKKKNPLTPPNDQFIRLRGYTLIYKYICAQPFIIYVAESWKILHYKKDMPLEYNLYKKTLLRKTKHIGILLCLLITTCSVQRTTCCAVWF